MQFIVDPASRTPFYRQLAAQLQAAVESGAYAEKERMPTENSLAVQLGVSKGTVKAAYACLLELGYIQKIRGSGIYVRRKAGPPEAATPAELVDRTLSDLPMRSLRLSDVYALARSEMAREFASAGPVRAALVDCNYETLHNLTQQLESVRGLQIQTYLVDELLSRQALLDSSCSLVLTPQSHYLEIAPIVDPLRLPVEQFALTESRETVAALTTIPDRQPICVLYRSDSYLRNIRYSLGLLQKSNLLVCCHEEHPGREAEHCALAGAPFLIPADYAEYSGAHALQIVERARKCGSRVIPFRYVVDGGSLLHLERRIRRHSTEDGGSRP